MAEAANVRFVSLQFTDIMGVVKNVHIPFHKFNDAVDHGLWFDGSSVEGFARIHESDMYLDPDLETFGVIPWERDENATAKVICDVYMPDGQPFAGDPRSVLRRQVEHAGAARLPLHDRPGAGVLHAASRRATARQRAQWQRQGARASRRCRTTRRATST